MMTKKKCSRLLLASYRVSQLVAHVTESIELLSNNRRDPAVAFQFSEVHKLFIFPFSTLQVVRQFWSFAF